MTDHSVKFRAVYLLLVAVLVGVAFLGIHTLTRVKPAPKHTSARWHADGKTSLAVAQSIARHYTALKLKGFEPKGWPRVEADPVSKLKIDALQIPFSSGMAQVALPPTDALYQICGQSEECAFVAPPTAERELLLRRLVLGLVVDTFTSEHVPKHVIVSLPNALVVFGSDEFGDKSLRRTRSLLARVARPKARAADIKLLYQLTNGRAFELADQVVTEDQKIVLVMKPRPCMDAACPS
jgi:hypothetical protein